MLEAAGLPPAQHPNPGLGTQVGRHFLAERAVQDFPGGLLGAEQVGNVQHLDVRVNGGVVAIGSVCHLDSTATHLVQAVIGVAQSATIDQVHHQRAFGRGLHLGFEDLVHAVDEVKAGCAFGQRQADLDGLFSLGRQGRAKGQGNRQACHKAGQNGTAEQGGSVLHLRSPGLGNKG